MSKEYLESLRDGLDTPNKPDVPELANFGGFSHIFTDLYRFGSSETAQIILTTIGGIVVIYGLLQVIDWLLSVVQSPRLAKFRHAGDDTWALVTGANDGIGKGFSEELCRRGFNVLLHGRNQEKLEKVKKELLEQWPKRKIDIVIADALKEGSYEIIVKKVNSLSGELTILVNNVGGQIVYPRYQAVGKSRHEDLDAIITANARFPTHLTAALIPMLQENTPSLIANSGSAGGVVGCPYITAYSATKAYIHTFSLALRYEMMAEGTPGVEVKGFIIGNTETTGNPHGVPFFTLQPRVVAASCLDRVGKAGGALVWSHWRHALNYRLSQVLPTSVVERGMVKVLKERYEAEQEEVRAAKKGS